MAVEANKIVLAIALSFFIYPASARASQHALDIYFIDVEGGAATLIVTPAGESLLIDSGFPEDRDAQRIAHVALEVAGLTKIDHYITTHWHRDHVGGIARLVKLIPVKYYYHHGLPTAPAEDIESELIEAYRETVHGSSITLRPGDPIQLERRKSSPSLSLRVLAANGIVVGEAPGDPQIKPCGPDFKPIDEDKTDNANSIGFLLSFGNFQFFDGGDLTWNVENKLVCPRNLVGVVDVFQVDHHGSANSNNPKMVRALQPRVAIIDNGPRKGGEPSTFATLKSVPELESVYQLHRNVKTTAADNALSAYVANDNETCQGEYIKVSVSPNARTYTVSIPGKGITRKYVTR
jgi:competence protein ComEC